MALRLAAVRPEERRATAAAFCTLFGLFAAYAVLETARDALFLARLPPSELPWVYLAMAAVAVALTQFSGQGLRQLSGRSLLPSMLAGFGVVTALFWAGGSWEHPWMLRGLYVWTGIVGTTAGLHVWLALGEVFTITQAKRLYQLVGTGSLVGAFAGAAFARSISSRVAASDLLLVSALLLFATAVGPALLLPRSERAGHRASSGWWTIAEVRALLDREPYVTRLAGLMLLSTVVLTLGDYVFKSAVSRQIPAAELGSFFAGFYASLSALALVAQVVLLGTLLRAVGLHRAMWILPALVSLGALGLAAGGGLAAALLLKGADGTLRPSLHRTGMELLYLPIPDGLRSRVKPVIDVLGQRGGQALASVFILAELSQHRGDFRLALAAALLGLVWIAWASELRPHYVEMFRRALRQGIIQRSAEFPTLDLASLETLFLALNSQDDGEVVAALDVLAEEGRIKLVPALILYHPSRAVVLTALGHFERSARTDFVPVADRLLSHSDAEVRAAALRARSSVQPDETVLRKARLDESPVVQATAVVGLIAGGWISDEAQETLDRLQHGSELQAIRALARAIERQPSPVLQPLLLELAGSPDPEVQIAVAGAMSRQPDSVFLPALLPMVAHHAVRHAAREALAAHGDAGVRYLAEALVDASLPHELRRHIPRILARIAPEFAGPLLLTRLPQEPDGMVRYKILRALGRIAADHPGIVLDRAQLQSAAEKTLAAVLRLTHWRRVLEEGLAAVPARATRGHELLAALLRDKRAHTVERLSRLGGLLYRGEDFERIYRGFQSRDPKVQASSRELLESLLRPPLREAILGLIEGGPAALTAGKALYRPEALDYEGLLALLLEAPGETLRAIAAHHAAELQLTGLAPRIRAIHALETGIHVAQVLERSLLTLDAAHAH